MSDVTDALLEYIQLSPSPFHCVETTADKLDAAGFAEVDEKDAPKSLLPGFGGYIRRAGSIVAWRAGN